MKACVKSMVFPWVSASLKETLHDDAHLEAVHLHEYLSRSQEELEILKTEKQNLLRYIGEYCMSRLPDLPTNYSKHIICGIIRFD